MGRQRGFARKQTVESYALYHVLGHLAADYILVLVIDLK